MLNRLIAAWLVSTMGVQPQIPSCPQALNLATELGRRFDLGRAFPQDETTFEISEQDPNRNVRYIRVRLRITAPVAARWYLIVRDANGHAVDVFSHKDVSGSVERWTGRVPGAMVRFDRYVEGDDPNGVQVHFPEYVVMDASAKAPYYSYQDPARPKVFPLYDEQSPATLDDRRLGDAAAFVMTASDSTQVWTCSGVVVAPGMLLTNWHCGGIAPMLNSEYWKDSICKRMLVDVSWDDDDRSQEFTCVGRPIVNEELDVAIVQIQPIDGRGAIRPATLSVAAPTLDHIKLVHHPEGHQKRISLNCSVKAVSVAGWRSDDMFDFTHDCDTEGGSSGAPIYDKGGRVIGLHHHGFKRNPKTCEVEDRVNKAVRMDEIVKWLDSSSELRALKAQMRIHTP